MSELKTGAPGNGAEEYRAAACKPEDRSRRDGKAVSRRQFLAGLGGVGVGVVLGGGIVALMLPDDVMAIEAAEGYLLVDTKKCAACESCMLACSLVHTGRENLALSRIQVAKDVFGKFPHDVAQSQCRQCPYPSCVEACPTGAMHVDPQSLVRLVDEGKCIGCERCMSACPFTPSRVQWNFEEHHAQKCDLCQNTPFWNREGGPHGQQACVEVCPMKAIAFTEKIPPQTDEGYFANLRNRHYAWLGFPVDDEGRVPASVYINATTPPAPPAEDAETAEE